MEMEKESMLRTREKCDRFECKYKCDPLNLDPSGISSKIFGKRFHSFDDRHRDGTIHHIIPFI